jgi:hypothetical protein
MPELLLTLEKYICEASKLVNGSEIPELPAATFRTINLIRSSEISSQALYMESNVRDRHDDDFLCHVCAVHATRCCLPAYKATPASSYLFLCPPVL